MDFSFAHTIIKHCWKPSIINLKNHSLDYGHAYLYEELFCDASGDISWLCKRYNKPSLKIADLAGGAGRVSIALAEIGHKLSLVDNSNSMLQQATLKIQKLPSSVQKNLTMIYEDLNSLELKDTYDVILAINNGLEHLGGETQIRKLLLKMKHLLNPDGEIVLDVHHPEFWKQLNYWNAPKWILADKKYIDNSPAYVWIKTTPETHRFNVCWEHAVLWKGVFYKHLKTNIEMYPLKMWKDLINSCGLCINSTFGDWNEVSPSKMHPKLIFILKKMPL